MKYTMFEFIFKNCQARRYISAFSIKEATILAQAAQIKDGMQYTEFTYKILED